MPNNFIPNSFQIANSIVDELLSNISGNSLKVYLFVVRKTRGWNKKKDYIALSQFQKHLQIKDDRTINKAIDELVSLNLIKKYKVQGKPNLYTLVSNPKISSLNVPASSVPTRTTPIAKNVPTSNDCKPTTNNVPHNNTLQKQIVVDVVVEKIELLKENQVALDVFVSELVDFIYKDNLESIKNRYFLEKSIRSKLISYDAGIVEATAELIEYQEQDSFTQNLKGEQN